MLDIFQKVNFQKLKELYLSYNRISEIDSLSIITNLKNINKIFINNNEISREKIQSTDNFGKIIFKCYD